MSAPPANPVPPVPPERSSVQQYVMAMLAVLAVTLPAFLIQPVIGRHAIGLIYLSIIAVIALFVGPGPVFMAATLSALIWDFFFLPPIPAFRISSADDAVLLAAYFVVALVLGQLTARIRAQQRAEREREARAAELTLETKVLAESERLGKNLLNSVSHEVRIPLSVIKSAVDFLEESDAGPLTSSQRSLLAEIQEAVTRLDQLIANLLDLTRLESGRIKPKLQWHDAADLVRSAVKETSKALARHSVTTHLASGLPLVYLDFVLMQRALANLLFNAASHTPPGAAVEVAARVEKGALLLVVADRGAGLDPESLPRVFDKFYRGRHAAPGGAGLGLSLVKGFVEANGGQVTAENREGRGAVFIIRLPVSAKPAIS